MYTTEEKDMMMKTVRFTGAIGPTAILPRLIRRMTDQFGTILDYGSGSKAIHTELLREEGYDVMAYDINPEKSQWHIADDDHSFDRSFEIVFASNVLNIQPSADAIQHVLVDVKRFLTDDGQALFNYPKSPRKSGLTVAEVNDILNEQFPYVERITGTEGWVIHTPVWKCQKDD